MSKTTARAPEALAASIISTHMARVDAIDEIIDSTSPDVYQQLLRTIEPEFDIADNIEISLAKEMPEPLQKDFRDISDAWGRQPVAVLRAGYLLGIQAGLHGRCAMTVGIATHTGNLSIEERVHHARRALTLIIASACADTETIEVNAEDVLDAIAGLAHDALRTIDPIRKAPVNALEWTPSAERRGGAVTIRVAGSSYVVTTEADLVCLLVALDTLNALRKAACSP